MNNVKLEELDELAHLDPEKFISILKTHGMSLMSNGFSIEDALDQAVVDMTDMYCTEKATDKEREMIARVILTHVQRIRAEMN